MKLVDQEHIILAKIYESSLDAILLLDHHYTIIWYNRATKTLLGYPQREINRKGILNFLAPPSQLKLKHIFNNLSSARTSSNGQYIELQICNKNGFYIPIEVSITATTVKSNTFYVCIARDISERETFLEQLDYQFQLAKLTSDLSIYFNQLPYEDLQEGTRFVFKQLGEFMGWDRIYTHLLTADMIDMLVEWHINSINTLRLDQKVLYKNTFPWLMKRLESFKPISIHTISKLQKIAQNEKSFWESRGVKSILIIPIFSFKKSLIGYVAFESILVEKRWGESEEIFLQTIIEMMSRAWERKILYDELLSSNEATQQTLLQTLIVVGKMLEKRDPYTAGHQARVAKFAQEIAETMGLTKYQIKSIYLASLVHDIGKIAIPMDILSRPGKLLPMEMEMIKTHPEIGYELLKDINFPWPIADIVRQHHERINGSGYPHGLKDKEILLETKILSIADVVESMMTHRPYRPIQPLAVVIDEITKNKGILYDPKVVDICIRLLKKRKKQ